MFSVQLGDLRSFVDLGTAIEYRLMAIARANLAEIFGNL
jgi:hypothetical protein